MTIDALNIRTGMATGDKQQSISIKKSALRDLPNGTRNTMPKPPGNSPLLKDEGLIADPIKVSGTKRKLPSFPLSPARCQQQGSSSPNGHLVYVRRKLEADSGKMYLSDSPIAKKSSNDQTAEPKLSEVSQEASGSPFPVFTAAPPASLGASSGIPKPAHSVRKPLTGLPIPPPIYSSVPVGVTVQSEAQRVPCRIPFRPEAQRVPNGISSQSEPQRAPNGIPIQSKPQRAPNGIPIQCERRRAPNGIPFQPELNSVANGAPVQPETQSQSNRYWQDRFNQLQLFLKSRDEPRMEEYMRKLRSLSAAGRSRHAYELEKRAIQLVFDEGRELNRMRVLNVLGKALLDDYPPDSPQAFSPRAFSPTIPQKK